MIQQNNKERVEFLLPKNRGEYTLQNSIQNLNFCRWRQRKQMFRKLPPWTTLPPCQPKPLSFSLPFFGLKSGQHSAPISSCDPDHDQSYHLFSAMMSSEHPTSEKKTQAVKNLQKNVGFSALRKIYIYLIKWNEMFFCISSERSSDKIQTLTYCFSLPKILAFSILDISLHTQYTPHPSSLGPIWFCNPSPSENFA